MANMVTNILKVPDLRSRVFFTILCLVIYRIGAHITTPGINPVGLQELVESLNSKAIGSLLSYIDLFAGGAFEKFTIFGLGIMPYITTSIVIQLLTTIIPHFEQLSKEGEIGRRKIQQYTRYGTILICAVQSAAISRWMASHDGVVAVELQGNSIFFSLLVVVTITTGTVFLMWLGEQITERGIGNGISLIIFAGIAARIPHEFRNTFEKIQTDEVSPVSFVLILMVFAAIIFFVVYEQEGQRRIPVQFARKVVGRKVYGSQSTYCLLYTS
ncbi:MAG: preprotein translocase subunit SecY, partial [Alphaproteobacteria bacterium]|nr:preprotein translocase subunit SecY [Alphaproteobacteria bacterium]